MYGEPPVHQLDKEKAAAETQQQRQKKGRVRLTAPHTLRICGHKTTGTRCAMVYPKSLEDARIRGGRTYMRTAWKRL